MNAEPPRARFLKRHATCDVRARNSAPFNKHRVPGGVSDMVPEELQTRRRLFSCSQVSFGFFAFGQFAVGVIAIGQVAVGSFIAIGINVAIAPIAIGGNVALGILLAVAGNLANALFVLAVGNVGLDVFGCLAAAQICMTKISPWASFAFVGVCALVALIMFLVSKNPLKHHSLFASTAEPAAPQRYEDPATMPLMATTPTPEPFEIQARVEGLKLEGEAAGQRAHVQVATHQVPDMKALNGRTETMFFKVCFDPAQDTLVLRSMSPVSAATVPAAPNSLKMWYLWQYGPYFRWVLGCVYFTGAVVGATAAVLVGTGTLRSFL